MPGLIPTPDETRAANVAASVQPGNGGAVPAANSVAPVTSSPSVISSQTGADIVGKKTQTLNKLSPAPVTYNYNNGVATPATGDTNGANTVATPTTTNTPASTSTKITLINPQTDQTVTYEDAAINKDNIQQYLNSGYQLSEASGALPSWLTPNGTNASQTAEQKAQAAVDSASADIKTLSDNLTKFTVSDADLKAQTDGISALWNSRIADMGRINAQRDASMNTLGIRLGDRYAGGTGGQFGGIITEEERQGVQRIADLEGQKQAAIAAAKAAAMTQNWSVYSKQVDLAQKSYDDKVKALATLQKATADQNKIIADKLQQQKTDFYNQVTKPMNDILESAGKNGAPSEILSAIHNATTLSDAVKAAGSYLQTGTGALGDYIQYKRDAITKGLTPLDYTAYTDQQNAKASAAKIKEAGAIAYAQAAAKSQSDANFTASDKTQQKLEQQYRQVLSKEFSARTGSLGIENAKVNQANHLNSLVMQYYDPKTGNYNIPTSQYAELVIGLANMISPAGNSSEGDRAEIRAKTAAGDLKGALQYATGVPQNGNTQAIIKNLVDSVDRQAETAIRNRESALGDMRAQAPTDLAPARVNALNKGTQMVGYEGQNRISKATVNDYVKANPSEAESIAKLYEIPGATDQDIEEYLKAQGKLQ